MVIQIEIPQNIIDISRECGWDDLDTYAHFSRYIREVMNHPYGHFEEDFRLWLEDLEEQE